MSYFTLLVTSRIFPHVIRSVSSARPSVSLLYSHLNRATSVFIVGPIRLWMSARVLQWYWFYHKRFTYYRIDDYDTFKILKLPSWSSRAWCMILFVFIFRVTENDRQTRTSVTTFYIRAIKYLWTDNRIRRKIYCCCSWDGSLFADGNTVDEHSYSIRLTEY